MEVTVSKPLTALTSQAIASGLNASTGLIVPDGATHALVMASTQNVRWTHDGTTVPTASVGFLLLKDTEKIFSGDLTKLRFIEVTTSATMYIQYYRA